MTESVSAVELSVNPGGLDLWRIDLLVSIDRGNGAINRPDEVDEHADLTRLLLGWVIRSRRIRQPTGEQPVTPSDAKRRPPPTVATGIPGRTVREARAPKTPRCLMSPCSGPKG